MATASIASAKRLAARLRIPPLENGDRLTRVEFKRRYEAMPESTKAELIDGVVFMPPPAISFEWHGGPHFRVIGWLALYEMMTPGVEGSGNASVQLLVGENEPEPDAFLRIRPGFGGLSRTETGYVVGSPELIAEVAASSASYDLHAKRKAYARNGVSEYVVWRTYDEAIDWFILGNRRYRKLPRSRSGIYKSVVFPGLWLDPDALIRADMARVRDILQQGAASPEHAEFVAKLEKAASRGQS